MGRDLNALREALSAYLPNGGDVQRLVPLMTGHSNETFLIEGMDHILRLPPASTPLLKAHSVITQARVYEELVVAAGAPRTPRIVHVCESAAVLGAPFFIMERVAGDSVNDYKLPDWFVATSQTTKAEMCDDWVTAIATFARLEPLKALGAAISPEQEAGRWREIAVNAESPQLIASFDRLLDAPRRSTGVASPVHGDCKIANMMFADGRLTAVLDWELGYNGEPLSDLGYMLYFFASEQHEAALASREPGMWRRDQVITAWEKGSGRSASGVLWYEALAIGKMAAILLQGYHLYASGQSTDPRFLRFKTKLDENLLIMDAILTAQARG